MAMARFVGSKWKKTLAICRHEKINAFVPETLRLSEASLAQLLAKFGMVYVKPEYGSHGKGVIRVERCTEGFKYQIEHDVRIFATVEQLYQALKKLTNRKSYLVQQGIHLLKHYGDRFDLRVMVQLTPQKTWQTTGIIGRVAAKKKIITNYHGGGKIVTAERLLSPHSNTVPSQLRALEKLGESTARAMSKAFPGVRKIGLDIAHDSSMKPWIIEVNTSPDPYIFRKHPNKEIFRTIMRYEKYGQ